MLFQVATQVSRWRAYSSAVTVNWVEADKGLVGMARTAEVLARSRARSPWRSQRQFLSANARILPRSSVTLPSANLTEDLASGCALMKPFVLSASENFTKMTALSANCGSVLANVSRR